MRASSASETQLKKIDGHTKEGSYLTYYGNGRTAYELDARIGGGGEGDVYMIKGKPDLVAKLYKPERLKRPGERDEMHAKLKAMLDIGLSPYANGNLIVAWPTDLLLDCQNQFVGYVMPAVHNKASIITACRPGEREQLFHHKYRWDMSVAIAYNLAYAVNHVHKAGIIIGDMNPNNVLVDSQGLITLIDCDSFQLTDRSGRVFRCVVGMGEMRPAELQGRNLEKPENSYTFASDRFALAIHIFNLLCNGCHPFNCPGLNEPSSSQSRTPQEKRIMRGVCPYVTGSTGKFPKSAPDMAMFPDEIRALFDRAFKYDAKTAMDQATLDRRPTAAEWYKALGNLFAKPMAKCSANALHRYPAHYKAGCPWCAIENRKSRAAAAYTQPTPKPIQLTIPAGGASPAAAPTPKPRKGTRINRRESWPLYTMCMLVGAIGAAYPARFIASQLSSMTGISWSVLLVAIIMAIVGGVCGAIIACLADDRYVTSNNGWAWMLLSALGPVVAWVFVFLLAIAIYLIVCALAICLGGAFLIGALSGS